MPADSPLVHRAVRTGGVLLALAAAQLLAVLLWVQDRLGAGSPWSTNVASLARSGPVWGWTLDVSIAVFGALGVLGLLFSWSAFDPRPSRGLGLLVLLVSGSAAVAAGATLWFHTRLGNGAGTWALETAAIAGGLGLVVVSTAMHQHGRWRVSAAYTLVSGLLVLVTAVVIGLRLPVGVGAGTLERVVVFAALGWALVEGLHLALLHRFAPGLAVKVAAA